jgi:hypothetical protein
MRLLKRFLQRLVIFGLGIFSVWFIVFVVFEFADRWLPWFLALAATAETLDAENQPGIRTAN